MPSKMVLERERLLPNEVILDFSDEGKIEMLIKRIARHEYFKEILEIEIRMKANECRFFNNHVDLATGKDPSIEEEYYVVVAEIVDERELNIRKLKLVGSSQDLLRLRELGKMQEYAQLHEELTRKKDALYLKLFDNL
jgi:hypothetical protein